MVESFSNLTSNVWHGTYNEAAFAVHHRPPTFPTQPTMVTHRWHPLQALTEAVTFARHAELVAMAQTEGSGAPLAGFAGTFVDAVMIAKLPDRERLGGLFTHFMNAVFSHRDPMARLAAQVDRFGVVRGWPVETHLLPATETVVTSAFVDLWAKLHLYTRRFGPELRDFLARETTPVVDGAMSLIEHSRCPSPFGSAGIASVLFVAGAAALLHFSSSQDVA